MQRATFPTSSVPAFVVLLGVLFLMFAAASPVAAQHVLTFTKDDCAPWNNPCAPPPPQEPPNCDGVNPPLFPQQPDRSAAVGARVQYQLHIVNDPNADTGLTLVDTMPSCVALDCTTPCVDTDCDTIPDSAAVWVQGGAYNTINCDEGSNTLTIDGIDLAADEVMDIKYCAVFAEETTPGLCCNDAVLTDGNLNQSPVDGLLFTQPALCVEVAPPAASKDDCAPRTTDPNTGLPDDADCDDVYTDAFNQRLVPAPASGKRIKWVLTVNNVFGGTDSFTIRDNPPADQTVSCIPSQDPLGQNWGCWEIYVNDVLTPSDPGAGDECRPGVNGGITVVRTLNANDKLEVRFCTRLNDSFPDGSVEAGKSCNAATARNSQGGTGLTDVLDGDRNVCVGEPVASDVTGTKTYVNLDPNPPSPGDTIEYEIELCEGSGTDSTVNFLDPLPSTLSFVDFGPAVPPECSESNGMITCNGLVILGNDCVGPWTFQATVACSPGTQDGDPICNSGQIIITDPPGSSPGVTDDPNNPTGDTDPTCFNIALDNLTASTKAVALFDDVDGDTAPDCEVDTLRFTIDVTNDAGASNDAVNVTLTDAIPAEITHVPGSTTVDGNPGPDPVGGVLTVDLGTMAPGDTHQIIFDATINPVPGGTIVSNSADITSDDLNACGNMVTVQDAGIAIACSTAEPAFDDIAKSVSDINGDPITEAPPGELITWTVIWCNTGGGLATNVRFEDVIDDCIMVQEVRLDGAPVPDPFFCDPDPGNPPVVVCFDLVPPDMNPAECHTVEIDGSVLADPGMCPDDGSYVVTNSATASSDNGASNTSPPDPGNQFTIRPASAGTGLRVNNDLIALDPLDPPKTPTNWGTIMDNGDCTAGDARLDAGDAIVLQSLFPAEPECVPNDDPSVMGALIFFEAVEDPPVGCDTGPQLTIQRIDCGLGGGLEYEVTYQ